jgi:hypothetical protein
MDHFLRVGIVGLKTPPFPPVFNRRQEDFGAPVFVPLYCNNHCDPNDQQIIAAQPVGLLLDHSFMPFTVLEFQGMVPHARLVPFSFYYQPLNIIMAKEPNLDLLISPN